MDSKIDGFGNRLLSADASAHSATKLALFAALSAIGLGLLFAIGPYPITLFPTDAIHTLVQADYLVRGYRPYVDYFSLHGQFSFLLIALGVEVEGISLKAVLLGQVVAAALFGTFMLKMAASRLNAFWAITLSLSVELILVSFTPLGRRSWREFSPAMWYNAISFSLTAIVFLYVLLPSRTTRPLSRWIDSFIAAFSMAAAFHTKMSFFPPIVIVFIVGTIIWPREKGMRVEGLATLALMAAMIYGFMWCLGGSLSGYLHFLTTVPPEVHPLLLGLRFVHHTRTLGAFLIGMLLVGWMSYDARMLKETRREWFLAFLMFGSWLATASTCKQDPEALPLIGVLPLAMTVLTAALARQLNRSVDVRLALPPLLIALFLTMHDAKNSALSLVFSHMTIKTLEPPIERDPDGNYKAAKVVSDRVDPEIFALMPKEWVDKVMAGLKLLKESEATPGDVVYVAAIPNGISLFTDFKYPRGDSPWTPFEVAADPAVVPLPVDGFLSDAKWILEDLDNPATWNYITPKRGDYIEENFTPVAHNEQWVLYARRAKPAAVGDDAGK